MRPTKLAKKRKGYKLIKEICRESQMLLKALGTGNISVAKDMNHSIVRKATEMYLIMANNKRRGD